MKYSIVNILLATVIAGLVVALYAENSRNSRKEAALISEHEKELEEQKNGLAVRYSVADLFRFRDTMDDPSVRFDYDFAALGLIVSTFNNADFLNGDSELRAQYGDRPAIAITGKLLEQLDCDNVERFFELYGRKMMAIGMKKDYQLGTDKSDWRADFTTFLHSAFSENN